MWFLNDLPSRCMPTVFQPLLTLDDEITHSKKHPIDDVTESGEIASLAELQAGYGFEEDVHASLDMAQELQDELGEDEGASSKRTAEIIKTTDVLRLSSKEVLYLIRVAIFAVY